MKTTVFFKMFLAAALVAVAGAVNADYATIYWRVDEGKASPESYSYAGVSYASSSAGLGATYLHDGSEIAQTGVDNGELFVQASSASAPDGVIGALPKAEGVSYDNYSFRIDLFDSSDNLFAISEILTLDQLRSNWSCVGDGIGATVDKAWAPAFTQVPEPTSGMLFLLGLASLALRRKRV